MEAVVCSSEQAGSLRTWVSNLSSLISLLLLSLLVSLSSPAWFIVLSSYLHLQSKKIVKVLCEVYHNHRSRTANCISCFGAPFPDVTAREEAACNQASQKRRLWESRLLPVDYHQLQAVRMVPTVRIFMERKLSGFCIFRIKLELLNSLQICLISPFGLLFIRNQTLVLIYKQWENSCSEICCNNIQSNTRFQLNCKPLKSCFLAEVLSRPWWSFIYIYTDIYNVYIALIQ